MNVDNYRYSSEYKLQCKYENKYVYVYDMYIYI